MSETTFAVARLWMKCYLVHEGIIYAHHGLLYFSRNA